MNKKKLTFFIICNSLICLVIGAFIPLTINNFYRHEQVDPNMEKFMKVYDTIKDEWYFLDDGDEEDYINRALDAMVNEQNDDKYLQYYPKKETEKDKYGIGVTVASYDGYLIIKDVYKGSTAEKANLTKDMIIMKVNDVDIHNMTINEVSNLISGPLNSEVVLICKTKDGSVVTSTVRRSENIKQSVYGTLKDGIGTLRVTGFENGTVGQFEEYLQIFKQNDTKELIIDLRDNGGGYIYSFMSMADFFLPKNKVLGEYIHRNPKDNQINYTEDNIEYKFDDIYILVNENSASASESFTCAMKDNLDNVTVLGENTYGKGIAQKTISFTDGSSLKYTVAEYLRPNKEVNNGKVHQIGVQPDIPLKDEGNYTLIDKNFKSFDEAKKAYLDYFNSLTNLSDEEQSLINKGKEELNKYNNKIVFSTEVKNLINKLTYDERQAAYEDQLNKVIKIAKED